MCVSLTIMKTSLFLGVDSKFDAPKVTTGYEMGQRDFTLVYLPHIFEQFGFERVMTEVCERERETCVKHHDVL